MPDDTEQASFQNFLKETPVYDEQMEKLIVALMLVIEEQGGEIRLDMDDFKRMYENRHRKGIQVQEIGEKDLVLVVGDMPVSPDDAMSN